ALVGRPVVLPDVELEEVHAGQPEVGQTLLGEGPDVVGRKDVVQPGAALGGPAAIFRRDLGGGVELARGVGPDQLAQEALAGALAVGPRRVEEVAAGVQGKLEGLARLLLVGARPARQPPHAVAHLADLPARAAERPVAHASPSPRPGRTGSSYDRRAEKVCP